MALLNLREYLKNHGMFERFEQGYVNYALHFSLWNFYSINEPVRSQILKELKEKWFDEFGICGRTDEYFFNKAEYRQFLRMNSSNRNKIPTDYRYIHKAAERIRKTGFWHFIYELLKDTGKYMLLNLKMLYKE